jgi:GAF domain-containing protein
MNMLNKFIERLIKAPNNEDLGQRAEILITLSLAVLSTLLPIFVYREPVVIGTSIITNAVALFTLYQAWRRQYGYMLLFVIVTSAAVCIATIFEGQRTHDLLWMANLGLFLLANLQSRRNLLFPLITATLMIASFAGTGLAEVYGLLENLYNTDLQYIYLNSFFFATIMAAITAIFHRHYSLLYVATESRNAQVKSNRELQDMNQTLEKRVEIRTRELSEANEKIQARASRLQLISEISREISSNVDQPPQALLDLVTKIISAKLNFYHVGVFLLDENREYAVLRAANSAGGKRMLERRHQLRVGGAGIVGYASQSGRPRIALDAGSDAVFFNNPDLPQTRSEMAIPLKYGSQVIGILDVQSIEPSAFIEEDANLLGTLANQIAIAVTNALAGSTLRHAAGRRGQVLQEQQRSGYTFTADGTISTAAATDSPLLKKALASGEMVTSDQRSGTDSSTLVIPVKFREQVIGVIQIEAADRGRKWTEDEMMVVQSISDRAAFALENARLFEETRRRAEQEEAIANITAQIGSSTDFNRILQTTIEELGRTLGATRTFIQLEPPATDGTDFRQQAGE